jgi:hypothetical protein
MWPPRPDCVEDNGDCRPWGVWLFMPMGLAGGAFFPPSAAVTMGFRLCMLKVSLRSSWEPRAVCRSLCRAHRSCRTNERWQSGKSQWYICLGLSAHVSICPSGALHGHSRFNWWRYRCSARE